MFIYVWKESFDIFKKMKERARYRRNRQVVGKLDID
jgi:hypothetical protein